MCSWTGGGLIWAAHLPGCGRRGRDHVRRWRGNARSCRWALPWQCPPRGRPQAQGGVSATETRFAGEIDSARWLQLAWLQLTEQQRLNNSSLPALPCGILSPLVWLNGVHHRIVKCGSFYNGKSLHQTANKKPIVYMSIGADIGFIYRWVDRYERVRVCVYMNRGLWMNGRKWNLDSVFVACKWHATPPQKNQANFRADKKAENSFDGSFWRHIFKRLWWNFLLFVNTSELLATFNTKKAHTKHESRRRSNSSSEKRVKKITEWRLLPSRHWKMCCPTIFCTQAKKILKKSPEQIHHFIIGDLMPTEPNLHEPSSCIIKTHTLTETRSQPWASWIVSPGPGGGRRVPCDRSPASGGPSGGGVAAWAAWGSWFGVRGAVGMGRGTLWVLMSRDKSTC